MDIHSTHSQPPATSLKQTDCLNAPIHPRYSQLEVLVTKLAREGVRALLLDWDGCMTPVSGAWHGVIALESLRRSPTFQAHASATLQDAIEAYEGPGHGIDWFALFEQNLIQPKCAHLPDSPMHIAQIVSDLRENVPVVAAEFGAGTFAPDIQITPNPGVEEFLQAARDIGLSLGVITMTPTPIVKAFAARSGLSKWISEFHGCETFSHFPETKADPGLWCEAASRIGYKINHCAIVEDSVRSLGGAVRAGAAVVISLTPGVALLREKASRGTQVWIAERVGEMDSVEACL
jgi:beta-phosphoglucomutase-like phosphatase (HAD superfamily)